jgi:hypothetical protein
MQRSASDSLLPIRLLCQVHAARSYPTALHVGNTAAPAPSLHPAAAVAFLLVHGGAAGSRWHTATAMAGVQPGPPEQPSSASAPSRP